MRTLRATLSSAASVALALGGLAYAVIANPSASFAAGSSLAISEINVAGSPVSGTSDQWIELYNSGLAPLDFSVSPYSLRQNGVELIALTSGVVPSNGYFLIAEQMPGATSSLAVTPDKTINLPLVPTDVQYTLVDTTTSAVIDTADDGVGPAFAGTATPMASMARADFMIDGSMASAWRTSATIGGGLIASVGHTIADQFGTPRSSTTIEKLPKVNREVMPPGPLTITPPNAGGAEQIFTGVFAPAVTEDLLAFEQRYNILNGTTQYLDGFGQHILPGSTTFSVGYVNTAGLFQFKLWFQNPTGDRTSLQPIVNGVTGVGYTVNPSGVTPAAATVSVPSPTKVTPVVATITTPVAASAVYVLKANPSMPGGVEVLPATGTGMSWSASLALMANSSNAFQVVYVDMLGAISAPTPFTVVHDSIAPMIDASKISFVPSVVGIQDVLKTVAGATEAGAKVAIYADQAMTQLIVTATAAGDGSFGSLTVGDNRYASVFVVATDVAGNSSAPVKISGNVITFAVTPAVTISGVTQTTANVTIAPIAAAVKYTYQLKAGSGAYSKEAASACSTSVSCVINLTGLSALSNYTVAVRAYDVYGNASVPTEKSFITQAAVAAAAVTTSTTTVTDTQVTTPVVAPVPAPVVVTPVSSVVYSDPVAEEPAVVAPVVSPSPSPETGQVEAAATDSQSTTPWVVLGILVALAILASAAYFYWFGGEAGTAAEGAGIMAAAKKDEEDEKKAGDAPASKSSGDGGDSKKRW